MKRSSRLMPNEGLQHDNNPKHTTKKAASWFKCSQIVVVSPILRLKLKIILFLSENQEVQRTQRSIQAEAPETGRLHVPTDI